MMVTVCSEKGEEANGYDDARWVESSSVPLCSLLPLPALPAKWEKIQFPSRRVTARSSPPAANRDGSPPRPSPAWWPRQVTRLTAAIKVGNCTSSSITDHYGSLTEWSVSPVYVRGRLCRVCSRWPVALSALNACRENHLLQAEPTADKENQHDPPLPILETITFDPVASSTALQQFQPRGEEGVW